MRKAVFASILGVVLAASPIALSARGNSVHRGTHMLINRIKLPGEGRGDFLLADTTTNRLFVTHSQQVHVLDLKTLKPMATVTGLTVAHGVALDQSGRAYVSDGKSDSVVVFDPATGRELKRIKAGGEPDAILFDPASSKILSFDRGTSDIAVIDPATASVAATIKLPNAPEFPESDGRGRVYVNLEEGNAIGVIDTKKMVLDHLIPLKGCDGPAPLALDKANRRLFSGCGNKVMAVTDADSGRVITLVPIGGDPDGLVYDAGTKRIVVGNRDGGWTVIRQLGANNYKVEQTLKMDEYAKTMALDPKTHRIFSSTADLVWPPAVPGRKRLPDAKPGSFRLIVVSQL